MSRFSKSCMCIMWAESNAYLKYTWMHEYIYCRESPAHPRRVSFPVVALLWNGVAWSLKAPHMRPPNRAAWCTSLTMEWEREGKWFGCYLRGWSSHFKAVCRAEALTGLLSALDVRPVMSLWRMRAVLAGKLRLHCMVVGVRASQRCLRVLNRIVVLRSVLLKQAGLKCVDPAVCVFI